MKTFLLDETGDLVVENGSFVWVEGDEELAQSVRVLLQTAVGEWFLDNELGVNRDPITAKRFSENEARDSIIESLAAEPRISSIDSIVFTKVGRELLIDLVLLKADGDTLEMTGVNINA